MNIFAACVPDVVVNKLCVIYRTEGDFYGTNLALGSDSGKVVVLDFLAV